MKHKTSSKQTEPKVRRRGKASVSPPLVTNSSIPLPPSATNGIALRSVTRCRKCKGFLVLQQTDPSQAIEIRCVNCGWQPRWGTKIVTEPEEIRSIRRLTAQFSSESAWHGRRTIRAVLQPNRPITKHKKGN